MVLFAVRGIQGQPKLLFQCFARAGEALGRKIVQYRTVASGDSGTDYCILRVPYSSSCCFAVKRDVMPLVIERKIPNVARTGSGPAVATPRMWPPLAAPVSFQLLTITKILPFEQPQLRFALCFNHHVFAPKTSQEQ